MYRAVTWLAMTKNISDQVLIDYASEAEIKLKYIDGKTNVYVNGVDVTDEIRTPEVSRKVAEVAQISAIREVLIAKQREMAQYGGVVMDGRDISSYVLPNADVKLFLTASIEERARRRWQELTSKGIDISLQNIANDIACRDKQDCEREIAPLKQAEDAILLDTTGLTIEGVVQKILDICRERAYLV